MPAQVGVDQLSVGSEPGRLRVLSSRALPYFDDSERGAPRLKPNTPETMLHRLGAVDRVGAYVDQHLGEALTLDTLARVAGMSKFHLHRVLLAQTGITPAQLVAVARLGAAMTRLTTASSPKIIDVAFEVGFENPSAFARAFRRHFGVTPRQAQQGEYPKSRWHRLQSTASPAGRAQLVQVSPFYCYGYEALGGKSRTFAQEAPAAFAVTFDAVERHGVEEVLGPLALPSGLVWAPPGQQRLLCAFRSEKRLGLGKLTERYVAGGRYLTLRHVGPYESRWQTWYKLAAMRSGLLGTHGESEPHRLPFELDRRVLPGFHPVADVYFPL